MRVVLLGIGNVLMSDEGVGVHAIEALQAGLRLPDAVTVVDGGTTGMELLPDLEDADHLIVIDAVRAGQPPAGIVRLAGEAVPAFFKTKLSPHQIGLSDILAALKFSGRAPDSVVLIGIEPVSLDLGTALSAEVTARLPDVIAMVAEELTALGLPPVRKE
jgi:hydrogenase maturation protease